MADWGTPVAVLFAATYVIALNIMAFVAFGVDKRFARRNAWRVPEMTLLLFALAGGILGALLGQRYFRHKTKKQPFKGMLYGIAVFQAVLIAVLFSPALPLPPLW